MAAAGAQSLAWLIGPAFLALVIVIVVSPVQEMLRRRGLPSWAATAVLVVLVYAVLLVLAGVVVVSIARLATILPSYADRAAAIVSSGTSALGELGVGADQLRAVASGLNVGRVVGVIGALLVGLTGLAGNLVFLLSLMLFMSLESGGARARIEAIAADRPEIAAALRRFAGGTRRFLLVTTVFGLITGALDALVLWWLGVPSPSSGGSWPSSPTTSPTWASSSASCRPRCWRCSAGAGGPRSPSP